MHGDAYLPATRATVTSEMRADAARAVLARYLRGATDDLMEARAAVLVFVRARRAAGDAPQEALIAVKELVMQAGAYAADRSLLTSTVDVAVRWCIEEYYRGDE